MTIGSRPLRLVKSGHVSFYGPFGRFDRLRLRIKFVPEFAFHRDGQSLRDGPCIRPTRTIVVSQLHDGDWAAPSQRVL